MENHAIPEVDKLRRKDVIDEMKRAREAEKIPRAKVDFWMASQDIITMGAFWDLIVYEQKVFEKITIPPARSEIDDFAIRYFGRCLIENPHGRWTNTRYEAAWEIIGWFNYEEDNFIFMNRLKEWLRDVYINNGKEVRDAIIAGTLEHLFEREKWREFFKDWLQEPVLASAYEYAFDWGIHHDQGKSRKCSVYPFD